MQWTARGVFCGLYFEQYFLVAQAKKIILKVSNDIIFDSFTFSKTQVRENIRC